MNQPQPKNKSKESWIWKIYFLIYSIPTCWAIIRLLYPSSTEYLFFATMTAFDRYLSAIYAINVTAAVLNLLALIPMTLYIYRKPLFSVRFWQIFLVFRFAFDIIGHTYEYAYLKATWLDTPLIAVEIVIGWLCFIFPSYAAWFIYAFRQKDLIPDQHELFNET